MYVCKVRVKQRKKLILSPIPFIKCWLVRRDWWVLANFAASNGISTNKLDTKAAQQVRFNFKVLHECSNLDFEGERNCVYTSIIICTCMYTVTVPSKACTAKHLDPLTASKWTSRVISPSLVTMSNGMTRFNFFSLIFVTHKYNFKPKI